MTRLVLLGVSVRALAQPLAGPRHGVVGADFFGDRDREESVRTYALGRDLGLPPTAEGLAAAARRLRADAVVYCANLENHPEVLASLAERCDVAGNGADVVRDVRDPGRLRAVCREAGIDYPATLLPGEEAAADPAEHWLVKRVRSGGGHGVRRWKGERLAPGHVLQRHVGGAPASVAFAADGSSCRVFGFGEQLAGRRAFGGSGYAWCGNLLPFAAAPDEAGELDRQAALLAQKLTRHFGLLGVNGADVVVARAGDGAPRLCLLEVNPRYSASMELAQWAHGLDVLALHMDACEGRLPGPGMERAPAVCYGKAVVYARRAVTVPRTGAWRGLGRRDVPYDGQGVGRGHPVCTVLARGATRDGCLRLLERRAREVYAELAGTPGEAAGPSRRAAATRPAPGQARRAAQASPSRPRAGREPDGRVHDARTVDLIGKAVE